MIIRKGKSLVVLNEYSVMSISLSSQARPLARFFVNSLVMRVPQRSTSKSLKFIDKPRILLFSRCPATPPCVHVKFKTHFPPRRIEIKMIEHRRRTRRNRTPNQVKHARKSVFKISLRTLQISCNHVLRQIWGWGIMVSIESGLPSPLSTSKLARIKCNP